MDHSYHMLELIKFTKSNSRYVPYAASLVDQQNNTLIQATADESGCPVLHAEINAIYLAHQRFPNLAWHELTMYSTGEPCAMCAAAICWSNLKTIVYGTDIPFMTKLWSIEGELRAKDVIKTFPKQPLLIESVCKDECNDMFLSFQQPFQQFWEKKRWQTA